MCDSLSITDKLQEILYWHQLCDKKNAQTARYTKINAMTIKKYIFILEGLDYSLREYLNKKGKDKLMLGFAEYFISHVVNQDQQVYLFQEMMMLPKKDRKSFLEEKTCCPICCCTKAIFVQLPCCNHYVCEDCLLTTIVTELTDLVFKSCKCTFCKTCLSVNYIRYILFEWKDKIMNTHNEVECWRYMSPYQTLRENRYTYTYLKNVFNRFITLLERIENYQSKEIYDHNSNYDELLKPDIDEPELYFAACTRCSPPISKKKHKNQWKLELATIEKQCANNEGNLLILEPEMFVCVVCKSYEENYDDGSFKKCPHCGIKTLKPEGCNYVRCGDHRWCFICNERLENNGNGHNKHFWTGKGTSPYSNQCRESINHDAPKFIIHNKCNCNACKEHNGAPLCRTLECMNRTSPIVHRNPLRNPTDDIKFNTSCQQCRLGLPDL